MVIYNHFVLYVFTDGQRRIYITDTFTLVISVNGRSIDVYVKCYSVSDKN